VSNQQKNFKSTAIRIVTTQGRLLVLELLLKTLPKLINTESGAAFNADNKVTDIGRPWQRVSTFSILRESVAPHIPYS